MTERIYVDGYGEKTTLEGALAQSSVFCVLATRNYIRDLEAGEVHVTEEIERAKPYQLPVVLFLFDDVTPNEKTFLLTVLDSLPIVFLVENCSYEPNRFRRQLEERFPELEARLNKLTE